MFKLISKTLGKIFGSKYERDVAEYAPIVEEINAEFERLQSLSHDDLRNRTQEFRAKIAEHLAGIDEDIRNSTKDAIEEEDFGRKEDLFLEVDKLKEERDNHLEEILKEILPEAFALV